MLNFSNYSEFIGFFFFGILISYSAVSLKLWSKCGQIQIKFYKKIKHFSATGLLLFRINILNMNFLFILIQVKILANISTYLESEL